MHSGQRARRELMIRWKEVIFTVKESQEQDAQEKLQAESTVTAKKDTPSSSAAVSKGSSSSEDPSARPESATASTSTSSKSSKSKARSDPKSTKRPGIPHPRDVQRETLEEGGRHLAAPLPDYAPSPLRAPVHLPEGFCKQCFVPLPDDPDAETLFIFLHALKYSTKNLGTWETPLPRWAGDNWDGDWRGWADGEVVPSVVEKIVPDSATTA
jgi:hypothetical protein